MKKCNKCNKFKDNIYFYKDKHTKDQLKNWCKTCEQSYKKIYYVKNKQKVLKKSKEWKIKNKVKHREYMKEYSCKKFHGITLETKQKLFNIQGEFCLICENKLIFGDKRTHYDHNHKTGKFRGFLCGNCNRALGYFKDSKIIISKALNYLKMGE